MEIWMEKEAQCTSREFSMLQYHGMTLFISEKKNQYQRNMTEIPLVLLDEREPKSSISHQKRHLNSLKCSVCAVSVYKGMVYTLRFQDAMLCMGLRNLVHLQSFGIPSFFIVKE